MAVTPYLAEDTTLATEWSQQQERLLSIMRLLRDNNKVIENGNEDDDECEDASPGDFVIVHPSPDTDAAPYVQTRRYPWGYSIEVQSNYYLKRAGLIEWWPQQLCFFESRGFEMDDSARGGNYRTVRKTPEQASRLIIEILRKCLIVKTPWQLHLQTNFDDGYTQVGRKSSASSSKSSADVLPADVARAQLADLVGLAPVKEKVRRLECLARMIPVWHNDKIDVSDQSMHLVFTGNPGTAKTTVARLLGSIYKDAGLLASGHVHEVSRATLVAPYIGQTAPMVKRAVKEAIGGILFIDEAYSLFTADGDNDFGHEAVAELMLQMENRRDEFIVIAAGYPLEMANLLDSNPGFTSRFRYNIEFADYTDEELMMIFFRMVGADNFTISGFEVQEKVMAAMPKYRGENFANGRWARKLFEETVLNMAVRLDAIPEDQQNPELRATLIAADIPDRL